MLFILMTLLACESVQKVTSKAPEVRSYKFINGESRSIYHYPKSDLYKRGDFELKSFELKEQGEKYVLIIEISNNFRNELAMPSGWDTQVFDIYLFTGNGRHKQALSGRKVKFSEPWERAILVSPLRVSLLKSEVKRSHAEVYDDVSLVENLSADIHVADRVRVYENKIFVELDREEFKGVMNNLSGVQVFSLNLNPYPADGVTIRPVEEYATEWNFGGGAYSKANPNVISILGDIQQLSSFEGGVTKSIFAEVHPVKLKGE